MPPEHARRLFPLLVGGPEHGRLASDVGGSRGGPWRIAVPSRPERPSYFGEQTPTETTYSVDHYERRAFHIADGRGFDVYCHVDGAPVGHVVNLLLDLALDDDVPLPDGKVLRRVVMGPDAS